MMSSSIPEDKTELTPREMAELKERVTVRLYGRLCALVSHLSRDHDHCGKAACARSRRCRGFACEPEVESVRHIPR
jgi:hypothetical protein